MKYNLLYVLMPISCTPIIVHIGKNKFFILAWFCTLVVEFNGLVSTNGCQK
jgi:hypothetical protein